MHTTFAHEIDFPSLRLVRSSRQAAWAARILLTLLLLAGLAAAFVPWQQTVSGSGAVIAYAPEDRQQTIDAPVSGRIVDWDPAVIFDGARVQRGQKLCEIQDLDPNFLKNLEEQRRALQAELRANTNVATAYLDQIRSFEQSLAETIRAADQHVMMAQQKVVAEERLLDSELANKEQLHLDFVRQRNLYNDGLASQHRFQVAERQYIQATNNVARIRANLEAARNDVLAKESERESKRQEGEARINSAQAQHRKAEGDLEKVRKALVELESRIAQQENQEIFAPRDGFLLRVLVNQGGQMVKQGDSLFILVPDSSDRAAEVWVSGNDVPLITPGRHVRMQFEGWPAVQFAGWPSVAVGTFGGLVAAVDAADNGEGKFRILVVPDGDDQPWPAPELLRQGGRANGWIMLDQVTLGYELWRRVNGFPPTVTREKDKSDSKTIKKAVKSS